MPTQELVYVGDHWASVRGPGGDVNSFTIGVTKPVASNSGIKGLGLAYTDLTPVSGDITVTTPGTVLSNLDVSGRIIVKAANVRIVGCRVRPDQARTSDSWLIDAQNSAASNLYIAFTELDGSTYPTYGWNGIGAHDFYAYRCDIHDVVDGASMYSTADTTTDASLVGSYVHELAWITPDPNHSSDTPPHTHNDGVQMQGDTGILIQGCNIEGTLSAASSTPGYTTYATYANAAVQLNVPTGPLGATIVDNWLSGGGDTINGRGIIGSGSTLTIKRNKFGANRSYYPLTVGTGNTVDIPTSGADANVYEATGAALTAHTGTITNVTIYS